MGSYEKAAQAYKQAASLQPDSAQAHLNLGVTQQELNDLAGARASYERALNIDPAQSGVLWNLALVLEQQGERQWAEKLYARINEDAPEWCDASFRLGYLRLLRGDYANSAAAFEACLAQRADWPEAHLNAGIAYARTGNGQAARKSFQDALMLRPDSSDAVRGLAALALEQEDFDDAYEQHRRLIELGEHGPELFYNAGLICQKRGQTQDAVAFYQQALNEDPQFAEALLNLGHALMSLGPGRRRPQFLAPRHPRKARTGADLLRAAGSIRSVTNAESAENAEKTSLRLCVAILPRCIANSRRFRTIPRDILLLVQHPYIKENLHESRRIHSAAVAIVR